VIEEDELDDYEVEKKPREKAIAVADENFDWDLYEFDLRHDYDKFIGYDIYKSKKSADERIEKLQRDFESGSNVLKINMLESMMLVDKFSDEITLRDNGTYKINSSLLSEFFKDLEYNVTMVEKIEELKDEIDFSIEAYEIDARKIFYIMRNASRLGLNNFNSHSQIFLFAKNNKDIVINAEVVGDEKREIGELELYVENFEKVRSVRNTFDFRIWKNMRLLFDCCLLSSNFLAYTKSQDTHDSRICHKNHFKACISHFL